MVVGSSRIYVVVEFTTSNLLILDCTFLNSLSFTLKLDGAVVIGFSCNKRLYVFVTSGIFSSSVLGFIVTTCCFVSS